MNRYFIDTNYLLRLLLHDNEDQFKKVYQLFSDAVDNKVSLITSALVFFEIAWVLSSIYEMEKERQMQYLDKILRLQALEITDHEILTEALRIYKTSALSLEDCYHLAFANSQHIPPTNFATFDKKLLSHIKHQ